MAKIITLYVTRIIGVKNKTQGLKISDELSKLIEERLRTNPKELIKVIINLDQNAKIVEATRNLSNAGLDVESTIPGAIPILAGAVAAIDIAELAKKSGKKN